MTRYWVSRLREMTKEDRSRLVEIALERLMELEEVGFRMDGDELQKDGEDEYFYWKSNGEKLV